MDTSVCDIDFTSAGVVLLQHTGTEADVYAPRQPQLWQAHHKTFPEHSQGSIYWGVEGKIPPQTL